MFDMRRQNRRNQADVMTQHEPKSDPRTFPTSSYADHKLDVARRDAAGNVIATHEHKGEFKEW